MANIEPYRSAARVSGARAAELDKRGLDMFNKAAREKNADEMERGKSILRDAIDAYRKALSDLMLLLKMDKVPEYLAPYKRSADEYLARMELLTKQLGEVSASPVAVAGGGAGGHKAGGGGGADDEKSKLEDAIASAILPEKPAVPWEEIAGLEQAVKALKEIVIEPRKFPTLFHPHTKDKPFGTVLLYGPPGTGKTQLARAVATEADCKFFSVKTSDLGSKWQGESEKLVHALFEVARKAAKEPSAKYPGQKAGSVVFIDEIDSVCKRRSDGGGAGGGNESGNKVLIQFLTELQGVGSSNDGVLFMGATNLPWLLDDAIIRRFEKKILIPLPEAAARQQMFTISMKNFRHNLEEWDFARLAQISEGKSGSDIWAACKEASKEPMRKSRDARFYRIGGAAPAAPGAPDTRTFEPLLDDPPCSACVPNIRTVDGRLALPGAPSGANAPPCRECGAVRMVQMDIPDGCVPLVGITTMADFERLIEKRGGFKGGVDMETAAHFATWTAQFGEEGS